MIHDTQPGHLAAPTRPDNPACTEATQPTPALYPGPPPVPRWVRRRRRLRQLAPDGAIWTAILAVVGACIAVGVIGVGTATALHVAGHYLHRGAATKTGWAPSLRTRVSGPAQFLTPAAGVVTLTPSRHASPAAATPAEGAPSPSAPAASPTPPQPTRMATPSPSPSAETATAKPSPAPDPASSSPAPVVSTTSAPAPTSAPTPAPDPPGTPAPTASAEASPTPAPASPTPTGA
jgi:hypothetical protein